MPFRVKQPCHFRWNATQHNSKILLTPKRIEEVSKSIKELKSKYDDSSFEIIPPQINYEPIEFSKMKPFKKCLLQQISPVIGYSSDVFPCCVTASEIFKSFSYGDINSEDFWVILRKAYLSGKVNFSTSLCPNCTGTDYEINNQLHQEILSNKARLCA